jgi:hypothetical protein
LGGPGYRHGGDVIFIDGWMQSCHSSGICRHACKKIDTESNMDRGLVEL